MITASVSVNSKPTSLPTFQWEATAIIHFHRLRRVMPDNTPVRTPFLESSPRCRNEHHLRRPGQSRKSARAGLAADSAKPPRLA